jgi:tetratricopeptide (TPR) repeat protein
MVMAARSDLERGKTESAISTCRHAIVLMPGHINALLLIADIALERGILDEAIEQLSHRAGIHPDSADLHYKLGLLLEAATNYVAAGEAYAAAARLNPGFAKAHNNRGSVLQMLGKMDEALACFKQAGAADPELWQASYNIGNLHKLNGRLGDAVEPFQQGARLRRKADVHTAELLPSRFKVTHSKLVHDIEQIRYLVDRGVLGDEGRDTALALERALLALPEPPAVDPAVDFPADALPLAKQRFNRLLNIYSAPAIATGALNRNLDWSRIEDEYFGNGPGMTYVDNFLAPEALASLRRFCLESTIWFDYLYSGGYVGCSCEDGFICPLLAQIAEEQRLASPRIFGEHRITGLWGYKYDSQCSGISEHADFAAVNVNFWLTPDDANVAPGTGGLVVWDKEAPADWDFNEFNNDPSRICEFLRVTEAKPYVVPHKQNRVVLFNSNLFHKTDSYHFKPGYENRRINVTMLYGYRQDAGHSASPA